LHPTPKLHCIHLLPVLSPSLHKQTPSDRKTKPPTVHLLENLNMSEAHSFSVKVILFVTTHPTAQHVISVVALSLHDENSMELAGWLPGPVWLMVNLGILCLKKESPGEEIGQFVEGVDNRIQYFQS
jgi:hypothetical protein